MIEFYTITVSPKNHETLIYLPNELKFVDSSRHDGEGSKFDTLEEAEQHLDAAKAAWPEWELDGLEIEHMAFEE